MGPEDFGQVRTCAWDSLLGVEDRMIVVSDIADIGNRAAPTGDDRRIRIAEDALQREVHLVAENLVGRLRAARHIRVGIADTGLHRQRWRKDVQEVERVEIRSVGAEVLCRRGNDPISRSHPQAQGLDGGLPLPAPANVGLGVFAEVHVEFRHVLVGVLRFLHRRDVVPPRQIRSGEVRHREAVLEPQLRIWINASCVHGAVGNGATRALLEECGISRLLRNARDSVPSGNGVVRLSGPAPGRRAPVAHRTEVAGFDHVRGRHKSVVDTAVDQLLV